MRTGREEREEGGGGGAGRGGGRGMPAYMYTHACIHIWVILIKIGQNCDEEGKNYVIGQRLACYRRHQKCMNGVGSVASLALAWRQFGAYTVFPSNEGISVTSDI